MNTGTKILTVVHNVQSEVIAGIVNQAVLLDTLENCVRFLVYAMHRNATL